MLATLLAVIGLYGVMAYTVARRTREIGVRMALGAVPGDVIWLVMREVLLLVGSGLVLGLIASWALGRYVGSQLYGVDGSDPLTIAGACVAAGDRRGAGRLRAGPPRDARKSGARAALRVGNDPRPRSAVSPCGP